MKPAPLAYLAIVKYGFNLHKVRMAIHSLLSTGFDSNIYLVTGDCPFLVDTGVGENAYGVKEWIRSIIGSKKLEKIVLTHRHIDHIGGVADLKKEFDSKVLIHGDDAAPVRGGDMEETGATIFGVSLCPVDVLVIKEGEIISSGEHNFRVIHTPGHSAGSICLFEESTSSLISGDTIFQNGVGRWDFPSGDYHQLLKSVRSLRQLKATNLYPGHGPCGIGEGEAAVERALTYLGEY